MLGKRSRSLLCLLLLFGGVASSALAQWTTDPSLNTLVEGATAVEDRLSLLADNGLGNWVLFTNISGVNYNVYLQHVDNNGDRRANAQWVGAGHQSVMATDGAGGVIVAWAEQPLGRVLAQRYELDLAGNIVALWGAPVELRDPNPGQASPAITTDGFGGAVISWTDYENGSQNTNIHAQRLDANGNLLWDPTTGFVVVNASGRQRFSDVVSDGAGGAYFLWEDDRWGANTTVVYARRVGANGLLSWLLGVPLAFHQGDQARPLAVADGSGGFFVIWKDSRNGLHELFGQHFDAQGMEVWPPGGLPIGNGVTSLNTINNYDLDSDGVGGLLVAFHSFNEIKAQRLTGMGFPLWGTNGVQLTSNGSSSNRNAFPDIAHAGNGDAVVSWSTSSNFSSSHGDVFAQYIDSAGSPSWDAGGLVVSNATNRQGRAALVTDGECPARVSWVDRRSGSHEDVYIQRLCNGFVGLTTGGGGSSIGVAVAAGPVNVDKVQGVPVLVEALNDARNARRIELMVAYDAQLLKLVGIGLEGTLLAAAEVEFDAEVPGVLRLVASGDITLTEGEPLFTMKLTAVGPTGIALVTLTSARIDEFKVWPAAGRIRALGRR